MKLRKRFLSIVLTVAMFGSSLQFPEMTLQAKELSEEAAALDEDADRQESQEQSETQETTRMEQSASEHLEGDAEDEDGQLESEYSEEETHKQSQAEEEDRTDASQTGIEDDEKEAETNGTETAKEETPETKLTETETTKEETESIETETTEEETESTETETTEEETTSTETETDEEETDVELEIAQIELDGVYQFGGAPSRQELSDEDGIALYADETDAEEYIYQQMLQYNEEINIADYGIPVDQIHDILVGLINEHPDLYFVNQEWRYSYGDNIVYTLSCTYDTSFDDDAFKRETQTALATVKSGMTDLQKAIALHDYITVNMIKNG